MQEITSFESTGPHLAEWDITQLITTVCIPTNGSVTLREIITPLGFEKGVETAGVIL